MGWPRQTAGYGIWSQQPSYRDVAILFVQHGNPCPPRHTRDHLQRLSHTGVWDHRSGICDCDLIDTLQPAEMDLRLAYAAYPTLYARICCRYNHRRQRYLSEHLASFRV